MKVLVLGSDGMFGHEMVRTLIRDGYEVGAATRRPPNEITDRALVGAVRFSGVDARLSDSIVRVLREFQPHVVINGIGIVKQRQAASDALESIRVNSLFPHELSSLCAAIGARLVHLSTDCVFSGRRGAYLESDIPDPLDLYGRSKLLGEVEGANCLTLRTSIIGLELFQSQSLVEWFLRQQGDVPGWTRAMFSGLTTAELARVVLMLMSGASELHGLWHVSSAAISKHGLLSLLNDALGRSARIVPDSGIEIDRSLDSLRFQDATGYRPPTWHAMIDELADTIRRREGATHA